jgi:hypothetical protein
MKARVGLAAFVSLLLTHAAFGGEDLEKRLAGFETDIKKTPNDPILHYRKAQCLMKLGKRAEGYETAKKAMALFTKQNKKLAWMMLEKVDAGHVRIEIHFNMGPRERKRPKFGIIRPLSFRVWRKGDDPKLVEIIDFEIGMMGGKPGTAALGKTEGRKHVNFGTMPADSTYATIRQRAVALIRKRHPAKGAGKGEKE